MRHRLSAAALGVVAAGALAAAAPTPATAARNASSSGTYSTSTYTLESCTTPATCTEAATALPSGSQGVATSVTRPELRTEGRDRADAWAVASSSFKLPSASRAEVSITWHIDEATGSANLASLEGAAVGRVYLDERIAGCPGCIVEDATTGGYGLLIVDAFASPTNLEPPAATASATPGTYTHTVIVRGANGGRLPRTLTVGGVMHSVSQVGCLVVDGDCVDSTLGHRGEAAASARGRITSIKVEPRS